METPAAAAPRHTAMRWAPRLLAVGVSLLLGIVSLDAVAPGTPFTEALPDFMMHLIPAAVVLLVVASSWDVEWIGAVAFVSMAVGYALAARAHPAWIAVISGPLLLVGTLYFWNATHRTRPT